MLYIWDVALYVCVSCFVVRGCAVSRRYINVCNCDMLSMCILTICSSVLCVLMVECMSVVVNVMSPPPALCNLSAHTLLKLCILVCLL